MRADWVECCLENIGNIYSGGTPKTTIDNYWFGDVPWITPADLSKYTNKYIEKGKKNITALGLQKSSAKIMPANSILFSSRAPVGYVAIAKNELSTNQGFKSIHPFNGIFSEYLYYYLKASKSIADKASSGTTFKELSKNSFSKLPVKLAPLPEQRAIVSKIETLFKDLDSGINHLKTAQTQLKTYRQAVLKKAFDGEFTKEWRNRLNLKHSNWRAKNIDNVVNIISGKNQKKVENPNGKYPIYGSAGLFGYANEYLCMENTTIIGRKGNINSPLYVTEKFWNVDTAFGLHPKEELDNKFLYFFCLSFNFKVLDKSTTIPSLSKRDILKINLLVPSIQEQTQIVKEIETRLNACDETEKLITESLAKAEHLRQSILKKAFEGKLLSDAELAECKKAKDYQPAKELLKQIKAEKISTTKSKKTTARGKNDQ